MTPHTHESHRSTPLEIFCSYAHKDDAYRQELQQHLSLLSRQGKATLWHDRRIAAGTNWAEAIDSHLETAAIILLLISADFLASQYCSGIEMQRALERHEQGSARVIPIIVRSCDWQSAPFATLQVLPTDGKPVANRRKRDTAWTEVVKGIRRVLDERALKGVVATAQAAGPTIWNVPFARNPFFTGRDELLERLHTQLQTTLAAAVSQPQAVSGLSGIGKTQLVTEYAYQYASEYQAVLWAQADEVETLNASYTKIAGLLNLPQKDAQEQEVITEAVKEWLREQQSWLLILDNADEPEILTSFLPRSVGGQVLVTTRASTDLTGLGLGFGHALAVETFTDEVGALFPLHRSGLLAADGSLEQTEEEDRRRAREIAHELGGLPLALDQAGAYIKATSGSLKRYQQIYQQHRVQLLRERRGKEHPEPVATTWSLEFQRVEAKNAAAADLLRLCAFLAPDAIPETLITDGAALLEGPLGLAAADMFLFDQAVEVLQTYSLLRRDHCNHILSVHRLVQVVLRDAMKRAEVTQWAEQASCLVNRAFPSSGAFEQWDACAQYLPHVLLSVSYLEKGEIALPEAAEVLRRAGWYLGERGQLREAEELLRHALTWQDQGTKRDEAALASVAFALAWLYVQQGKYVEAEQLYQRALSVREQHLGVDHPNVATSLNNLADLYKAQGRYAQAEQLYQRALSIFEQQLGTDHPDTATSLNNLADLYQIQGKYAQAEPLYLRALAIREQHLGVEHPDTANSLSNLAGLYYAQGQYAQAESLLQGALSICEHTLGLEHPHTQTVRDNYAALLKAMKG